MLATVLALAITLPPLSPAAVTPAPEIRPAGDYSGIVLFDRWGDGYLSDGGYVYPLGTEAKKTLRPYQNRRVRVHATECGVSTLTGDTFLIDLTVKEPTEPPATPTPSTPPATPAEIFRPLEIEARVKPGPRYRPRLTVTLRNPASEPTTVELRHLAPIILAKRNGLRPEDTQRSHVLCSRMGLAFAPGPKVRAKAHGVRKVPFSWTLVDPPTEPTFALASGESRTFVLDLDLVDGEYQCYATYSFVIPRGGGRHPIASRLRGFDVEHHRCRVR
ncbi:MAG: hypothetical protein AAF488_10760 [Planctomycetota bacterium]